MAQAESIGQAKDQQRQLDRLSGELAECQPVVATGFGMAIGVSAVHLLPTVVKALLGEPHAKAIDVGPLRALKAS